MQQKLILCKRGCLKGEDFKEIDTAFIVSQKSKNIIVKKKECERICSKLWAEYSVPHDEQNISVALKTNSYLKSSMTAEYFASVVQQLKEHKPEN